jgi:signal transduction histidine kinase
MRPRSLARLATLPVAVGASIGLLLLLGSLQYQWVGQLADGERAQIHASASARAQALAHDFDREVTRAFLGLHADAQTLRDRGFERFAERYDRWRSRAAHPALVKAVFLAEPRPGNALRLSRFDPAARAFGSVDWPGELSGLRERVESHFRPGAPGSPPGPSRWKADFLDDELPAFTFPILGFPARGRVAASAVPAPPRAVAVEIVLLDLEIIRGEVLPLLAERHFAGAPPDQYDLVVTRPREGGTLVWRSRPEAVLVASGDAAATLLSLRPEDLGPEDYPGPRTFSSREAAKAHGGPDAGVRRIEFNAGGAWHRIGESGRWRLVATHRAGSIDHVVAAARERNLGVSFGILALLGASTALVVATAQRARRLGERQMEFVAGVSHELRTPVAVLFSAGENLADGVVSDPAQVRRYGALVRDQGRRLAEMVEQVLALAGTYSGRPVYARLPVTVASLVDEAIETCAPLARAAGFTVAREVAADLPEVEGDSGALGRAIVNLLTNAMKHGAEGRWLAVRAVAVTAGSRTEVRITVQDKGPGIPKEERARIFEPFVRGREARAAQTHGFGLGLSLVKRVMEAHGGRVSVSSPPGQGAAFTLHLPAAGGTPATVREAAPDVPHPAS